MYDDVKSNVKKKKLVEKAVFAGTFRILKSMCTISRCCWLCGYPIMCLRENHEKTKINKKYTYIYINK